MIYVSNNVWFGLTLLKTGITYVVSQKNFKIRDEEKWYT